jgi:hypothetical protein
MNRAFFAILLFVTGLPVLAERSEPVSLLRLIASPSSFDGKRVSTMGVLKYGDLVTICIDQGSAKAGATFNCIALQQNDPHLTEAKCALLDGNYVQVTGIFDTSRPRPRGFESVIRDIDFVRKLDD